MLQTTSRYAARVIRRCYACQVLVYQPLTTFNLTTLTRFQFTVSQPQLQAEQAKSESSKQEEQELIALDLLVNQVRQDISNNYSKYQLIRSSFSYYLKHNKFGRGNQQSLIQIIELLSNYPIFPLNNQEILTIYRILCYNLHLKSIEDLNIALKFVLLADQNVSQSPIYLQFIKFYLQVTRQYLKVKYQIDFQKLSVWQAIKKFIGRTVQRGFLPRSPQYQRNLNILDHEQILYRLVHRKDTRESLMIKKLNYTIFMDLKEFYEEEMKENLYHWKKVELMSKFNHKFMRVLAQQLPMIHHQSTHLRQLYMKLYLTLPMHDQLSPEASLTNQFREKWLLHIEILRIKNVISLYRLAQEHIRRMDHLKLEQISEKIDIVIEFVQNVEHNIKQAANTVTSLNDYALEFDQMLLLMELLTSLNLQRSGLFQLLIERIKEMLNPVLYSAHFQLLLKLLQNQSQALSLAEFFKQSDLLSLLSLQQLDSLSKLTPQSPKEVQRTMFASLGKNIVTTILSKDFEVIGGKQISTFLNIFKNTFKCLPQQQQELQNLRKFVMRYISDHYKQFSLSQFETILNQLLDLPSESCNHFQDEEGNYTNPILQELQPYISKIELLLTSQTSLKLKQKSQTKNRKSTIIDDLI